MKRLLALCAVLVVCAASSTAAAFARQAARPEILGVALGMSEGEARARLRKIGRLEKEERKKQEVWVLNDEPRFGHLIVGFDKATGRVRYVTAKARPAGERMRYADVLDVKGARRAVAPRSFEYVAEVAARGKQPAYQVIARGPDPEFLLYYSIKQVDAPAAEGAKK
ncbi:MAG TPA: hypothetical protein VK421_04825 [Pyrinomonadaceae bacterium]|nr:hypothetical protein [Pyrinomonadaceae bacterium]